MWSGPVGLAETNSTLIFWGWATATRPQVSGSARMRRAVPARAASESRRLRKPGAAAVAAAMGLAGSWAVVVSRAAIAWAIWSGARRRGLASFMATGLAKSPCVWSAGRSTSMGTSTAAPSGATSSPAASARRSASAIASRATLRRLISVDVVSGMSEMVADARSSTEQGLSVGADRDIQHLEVAGAPGPHVIARAEVLAGNPPDCPHRLPGVGVQPLDVG